VTRRLALPATAKARAAALAVLATLAAGAGCRQILGIGGATFTGAGGAGGAGGATSSKSTTTGHAGAASMPVSVATGTGGAASMPASVATGTGGAAPAYVYAHTNATLFQIDPTQTPPTVTPIGDFDCIGGTGQDSSMTDLAVGAQGGLWGISAHNVYGLTIVGSTVHCTTIIPLADPMGITFYALAFVPAGVIDPSQEVLVTASTAGDLYAIDAATGSLTQHGSFGLVPPNDGHGHTYAQAGVPWEVSGDLVFLANGGNLVGYASVRDCPNPPGTSNCDAVDTLVEIDMMTIQPPGTQTITKAVVGQMVTSANCMDPSNTGYGSTYGLAAHGSEILAFSHHGQIVAVSPVDGSACIAVSTPSQSWAGAAVSPLAPVQLP
jgi:hypothetical protein